MTQHSVGDKLARGDASAQFSTQSGISDFENDLIFRPEQVAAKYGLTETLVEMYQKQRINGEKLPDLQTKVIVEEEAQDKAEAMRLGYTVTDRRLPQLEVVKAAPLKYPHKEYTALKPVLDWVLLKRTNIDEEFEELSDGGLRNKRTGFIVLKQYREHQNVGVVLEAGKFAVMGGIRIPMEEIVRPGDRVTYGDYNSQIFTMDEKKIEALCDALMVNYIEDPEGLRLVRVQDIRGVENPLIKPVHEYKVTLNLDGKAIDLGRE